MAIEINPRAAPSYDRETMLAVIRAYQAASRSRLSQIEIEKWAIAAFMERHPDSPRSEVVQITPHIIAWAAREHGEWFWKGCERPYVDLRREPVWDPVKGHLVPGPPPPGARDSY